MAERKRAGGKRSMNRGRDPRRAHPNARWPVNSVYGKNGRRFRKLNRIGDVVKAYLAAIVDTRSQSGASAANSTPRWLGAPSRN